MSGSRGRGLNEGERMLWREVTRSIAPLRKVSAESEPGETRAAPRPFQAIKPQPARPRPEQPPPLATLGRRAKQRVARGRDAIDGRLDLHGLTQAEAHDSLLRFLQLGQTRGARLVVVITGKGRGGQGGVLKRQVPLWLALPEFRALVVGFEEAHQRHGGEGALYLRLRKGR
jgi:DNA-nicking Smr family endonuclease